MDESPETRQLVEAVAARLREARRAQRLTLRATLGARGQGPGPAVEAAPKAPAADPHAALPAASPREDASDFYRDRPGRDFVVKAGRAFFQAGAGIVADSDPEREYDETLHKALGMAAAL